MLTIVMSSLATPAAFAKDALKRLCFLVVKAASEIWTVRNSLMNVAEIALGVQFVSELLPGAALLPTSHGEHADDDAAPAAGEKVSRGHLMHTLSDEAPRDEEFPGLASRAPSSTNNARVFALDTIRARG